MSFRLTVFPSAQSTQNLSLIRFSEFQRLVMFSSTTPLFYAFFLSWEKVEKLCLIRKSFWEEKTARKKCDEGSWIEKLVPESFHELTNFPADAPRKRNLLIWPSFVSFFLLFFVDNNLLFTSSRQDFDAGGKSTERYEWQKGGKGAEIFYFTDTKTRKTLKVSRQSFSAFCSLREWEGGQKRKRGRLERNFCEKFLMCWYHENWARKNFASFSFSFAAFIFISHQHIRALSTRCMCWLLDGNSILSSPCFSPQKKRKEVKARR